MGDMIAGPAGTRYQPAEAELTSDQIVQRYGTLTEGAVSAFRTDPSYLVEMAEHARLTAYKRSVWEIRKEAAQQVGPCPEAIKDMTMQIMAQRGINPPARLSRGSRRTRQRTPAA